MGDLRDILAKLGAASDPDPGEEAPFSFGFKAAPVPDSDRAWEEWSRSGRRPEDNLRFLEAVNPVVDKAVRLYAGGPDPVARSRARLMALRAAGDWDRRKSNLQTHLLTRLQPLRRFAASRRQATRVPERAQWQLSRLREAEAELRDDLDRDPTELELADRTGFSLRRLGQLRRHGGQVAAGTFLEAESPPAAPRDRPDEWLDFVYHDLSALDRVILEGRAGYNGKPLKSVTQLARELGVGAATVSRRAARIADLLARRPKGW
jgi:hypothetical protein